jgi:hypothetical protein
MCFFPSVFSEHRNTTWGRDFTSILLAPLSVLEIHGLSFFFWDLYCDDCDVEMMENDGK